MVSSEESVLGLSDGPVTADVVLTNEGVKIMEISHKFHSSFNTEIRDGGRSVEAWLRYMAGRSVSRPLSKMDCCAAANITLKGSAAHVKASLMGFQVGIPVSRGSLMLGTWQGLYLCEVDGPRSRRVIISVL